MEIEYFVPADPEKAMEIYNQWKADCMQYWTEVIGINPENLRFKEFTIELTLISLNIKNLAEKICNILIHSQGKDISHDVWKPLLDSVVK